MDSTKSINVLSLCSGAGGLDLGVKLAIPDARTVCYVEIEAYACEVLASRMEEGRLDSAPIWTDLKTFRSEPWRGVVDLVIGGYPCQPFSLAGKRLGEHDPRHLWPDVARIVRELNPTACIFENVSGHVSKGLRDVRCELESMGYRVEAEIVRAEEVGAPHRRERVFISAYAGRGRFDAYQSRWSKRESGAGKTVSSEASAALDTGGGIALAYADSFRGERSRSCDPGRNEPSDGCRKLADPQVSGCEAWDDHAVGTEPERSVSCDSGHGLGNTNDPRLEGRSVHECERPDQWSAWPPGPSNDEGWRNWTGPQPAVCRDANGLAHRVDRLRLCGNGVVPQQAAYAIGCLMERMK